MDSSSDVQLDVFVEGEGVPPPSLGWLRHRKGAPSVWRPASGTSPSCFGHMLIFLLFVSFCVCFFLHLEASLFCSKNAFLDVGRKECSEGREGWGGSNVGFFFHPHSVFFPCSRTCCEANVGQRNKRTRFSSSVPEGEGEPQWKKAKTKERKKGDSISSDVTRSSPFYTTVFKKPTKQSLKY